MLKIYWTALHLDNWVLELGRWVDRETSTKGIIGIHTNTQCFLKVAIHLCKRIIIITQLVSTFNGRWVQSPFFLCLFFSDYYFSIDTSSFSYITKICILKYCNIKILNTHTFKILRSPLWVDISTSPSRCEHKGERSLSVCLSCRAYILANCYPFRRPAGYRQLLVQEKTGDSCAAARSFADLPKKNQITSVTLFSLSNQNLLLYNLIFISRWMWMCNHWKIDQRQNTYSPFIRN